MFTVEQPPFIVFGINSVKDYQYPKDCLIITTSGAKKRGWIDYLNLDNAMIFDQVESNPSMKIVEKIIDRFRNQNFSTVIGIGGGSALDVAKFVAFKLNKKKILIPTTFGSGSEVTRISVLKIEGKKKSFHNDKLFADTAIIDPYFYANTDKVVKKNSLVDALAQCSEGFDSKIGNMYTKFFCENAFKMLEEGFFHDDPEKIALGSLFSGLGFGNCSTTLGHALSYVFSNEGVSHGHALAFTTTVAHKFNDSVFYEKFLKIVTKMELPQIRLKQDLNEAAELILTDKKHLDNNPKNVSQENIIELLEIINSGKGLIFS